MSSIIELVIDIAVELVSDWTIAKWPLAGEAVGLVCLVIGALVVGLSSSGADRVQAFGLLAAMVIAFVALLLYSAWHLRRAAAVPTERLP
ncbi:hypothetical protein [Tardiphaga robiniae]|uniref:Uncharacterized protein n=1 Tax=Tardiphaga robiniae TaxID=943830 RepID=A0A7G6TUY8_9BRAD|nr:hypothetical protein [Tardiphaga robiniae]QND70570.1 hypothetical protein HB776_04435 [Tardiphaga robiniae]